MPHEKLGMLLGLILNRGLEEVVMSALEELKELVEARQHKCGRGTYWDANEKKCVAGIGVFFGRGRHGGKGGKGGKGHEGGHVQGGHGGGGRQGISGVPGGGK